MDGIKHSIKTQGDYTLKGKSDVDLGDLRWLAMGMARTGRCPGPATHQAVLLSTDGSTARGIPSPKPDLSLLGYRIVANKKKHVDHLPKSEPLG